MREIKFRGKTIPFVEEDYEYKGEWVYGYFHKTYKGECYIIEISKTGLVLPGRQVVPESVGQFTGLKDDKGITELYEGDIIKFGAQFGSIGVIKFIQRNAGFEIKDKWGDWNWLYDVLASTNTELLGNIHENPELLCTSQST